MSLVDIIYCDNHLLVLDKPGGLLTQPSGTAEDSLESRGKQWLKGEFNKPGAVFLEAVHRIDRAATGIVLFARTSKALSRLNASMRAGECDKTYLALVEGTPPVAAGRLEDWLVHGDHAAAVVPAGIAGAKLAVLDYEVVAAGPGGVLLRIRLGSGRYHQIRVQLARAGMPIVGDGRYGARRRPADAGIALQHCRLRLPHPVSREIMDFKVKRELDAGVSWPGVAVPTRPVQARQHKE